ncbi:hypothetical protein WJX73_002644 [Symbiochloris irregularis]|uniref:NIPSNAP domain-containing protein n=1 Tax=Symbiochloris irregularis TaxID=706552 RepID=A0AAW1NRQ7_9CHLO
MRFTVVKFKLARTATAEDRRLQIPPQSVPELESGRLAGMFCTLRGQRLARLESVYALHSSYALSEWSFTHRKYHQEASPWWRNIFGSYAEITDGWVVDARPTTGEAPVAPDPQTEPQHATSTPVGFLVAIQVDVTPQQSRRLMTVKMLR